MSDIDNSVTDDQVRDLAYRLWEEEGQQEGRGDDYWHRARQLLEAEAIAAAASIDAAAPHGLAAEIIAPAG